jgi:DNA-binding NtrC family response regulator
LIEHILQSHGYKVIGCTNGKEALELWQEHRRKIELLLTDMVLPDGMTGPDLAEIVQISKPGIKVIFMSGYDTSKFGQTVSLQPGVNFLAKPFHARTLAETVFDTLQKK